ncbi:MAG: hypothetical protein M1835_003756 [Candelina submexicana]|nr:MAG: hypothetical protein M1835_003756 [Candelina submexicana]
MDYQFTTATARKREYSPSPDPDQSQAQEPPSPSNEHRTKRRKAIPVPSGTSEVLKANALVAEAPCEVRIAASHEQSAEQESSNRTASILDQLSDRLETLERVRRMQGATSDAYGGEEEEQQIKALKEIREMLYSMAGSQDDLMKLL